MKPILKLLLLSLMLLFISTGCTFRNAITDEFADRLTQMNADSIESVAKNVEIIDQNLYTTEEKLLKLEQVVAPALEWVENQKVKMLEQFDEGSWRSRVTDEGLAEFKNDQYQISALELSVTRIGTPNQKFYTEIKVVDLETKEQYDWEVAENQLKSVKDALEKERQAKLEDAQLSTATLLSVLEHSGEWKVQEINSTTYGISGPGLGEAGELTSGNWTYFSPTRHTISWTLVPGNLLDRGKS